MHIATSDASLIVTFSDLTLKITDATTNTHISMFYWAVTKICLQQQLVRVSKSVSFQKKADSTWRNILFENSDLCVALVQEQMKALTVSHLTFNDHIVLTLSDWEKISKEVDSQVRLSMLTDPAKFERVNDQMMSKLKASMKK